MPVSYSKQNGWRTPCSTQTAYGVGADDLAPGRRAAPGRPPLVEGAAGAGAGVADECAEDAVAADEVGELAVGGERGGGLLVPAEVGHGHAALGGDACRSGRTEGEVVGAGARPGAEAEAVDHADGVEHGQACLGFASRVEADVGYLGGGEDPMVEQQPADPSVPFGEPTGQLVESIVPTHGARRTDPAPFGGYLPHSDGPAPLPPLSASVTTPLHQVRRAGSRPRGGSHESATRETTRETTPATSPAR